MPSTGLGPSGEGRLVAGPDQFCSTLVRGVGRAPGEEGGAGVGERLHHGGIGAADRRHPTGAQRRAQHGQAGAAGHDASVQRHVRAAVIDPGGGAGGRRERQASVHADHRRDRTRRYGEGGAGHAFTAMEVDDVGAGAVQHVAQAP
ncbi:MAG: hypothetical protein R2749_13155 [Acidimicrobiales bacterium]